MLPGWRTNLLLVGFVTLMSFVSDRCFPSSAWPCSRATSTCGSWRGDTAPRDLISRRWRHQWAAWRQRALEPGLSIDLPQSGRHASVLVAVIRLTVAALCLYDRIYCERERPLVLVTGDRFYATVRRPWA